MFSLKTRGYENFPQDHTARLYFQFFNDIKPQLLIQKVFFRCGLLS